MRSSRAKVTVDIPPFFEIPYCDAPSSTICHGLQPKFTCAAPTWPRPVAGTKAPCPSHLYCSHTSCSLCNSIACHFMMLIAHSTPISILTQHMRYPNKCSILRMQCIPYKLFYPHVHHLPLPKCIPTPTPLFPQLPEHEHIRALYVI